MLTPRKLLPRRLEPTAFTVTRTANELFRNSDGTAGGAIDEHWLGLDKYIGFQRQGDPAGSNPNVIPIQGIPSTGATSTGTTFNEGAIDSWNYAVSSDVPAYVSRAQTSSRTWLTRTDENGDNPARSYFDDAGTDRTGLVGFLVKGFTMDYVRLGATIQRVGLSDEASPALKATISDWGLPNNLLDIAEGSNNKYSLHASTYGNPMSLYVGVHDNDWSLLNTITVTGIDNSAPDFANNLTIMTHWYTLLRNDVKGYFCILTGRNVVGSDGVYGHIITDAGTYLKLGQLLTDAELQAMRHSNYGADYDGYFEGETLHICVDDRVFTFSVVATY